MPAKCQSCGHAFEWTGFEVEGPARNLEVSANVLDCPSCGGVALLIAMDR